MATHFSTGLWLIVLTLLIYASAAATDSLFGSCCTPSWPPSSLVITSFAVAAVGAAWLMLITGVGLWLGWASLGPFLSLTVSRRALVYGAMTSSRGK